MRNLSWGVIFLILLLLVVGLYFLTNVRFVWMGVLMGVLAVLSAVAFATGK